MRTRPSRTGRTGGPITMDRVENLLPQCQEIDPGRLSGAAVCDERVSCHDITYRLAGPAVHLRHCP